MAQEKRHCQGKLGFHGSLGGEKDSIRALPTLALGSVLLQWAPSRTLETINHSQGFIIAGISIKDLGLEYWYL